MPYDSTFDAGDRYGPRTDFGRMIHATKYRAPEERFDDFCVRYARAVSDDERGFRRVLRYVREQVLLPAGRQQHSMGRPYQTTAYNCFVGGEIPDSYEGIMDALKWGGMTLRTGGGVGWDFSTLRPQGEPIRGLGHGSFASGPLSFMSVWNVNCQTILTAGHRRGAMMGVLSVEHPDILAFINAKKDGVSLKNFNISVALTDRFMEALECDGLYELRFGETVFGQVRATDVWAVMMQNNWDWAEPGALFIDRINRQNPLAYCETIRATNPCAEQPLPPWGACLLGSINIVKLLSPSHVGRVVDGGSLYVVDPNASVWDIDWELLDDVVDCAVRAFDTVPDRTIYPLPQQKEEALAKRRMGVGVTGMANAIEIMGCRYGSDAYLEMQDKILERIAVQAYRTSIELAKVKGSFPLFDQEKYLAGWFVQNRLPDEIRDGIARYGLRNGLLLSIAPTGTISMAADNISSGIEPPFSLRTTMDIEMPDGKRSFTVEDYALNFFGVAGQTANETSAQDHIRVLCGAQRWVDSSVSKTCNVTGQIGGKGPGVTFAEFKDLYLQAYQGGAKGATTFNCNGKLMGVRHDATEPVAESGAACFINPDTGLRSCDA
jgi:ribonucleoside-diphosphate reductase alpha chain